MKIRRWITLFLLSGLLLASGPGTTRVLAGARPPFSSGPVLADLPAGPALVLTLDEPAGATTFVDLSGQSNHGTCAGDDCPEAGQPGKYGLAPHFDGAQDRIDTPLDIDQSSGSPGATMMAWVYLETVQNERDRFHVISTDDGGFDWSILRRGHTWHVFTGEQDHDTGFGVQYGTWQHIAAVFEPAGNRVRFYKNGRETVVPFLGYDSSDHPVAIGDNPGPWDEYFKGKIDEVRVYERALSGKEVLALYEGGGSGGGDVPCDAGALIAAINRANASPGPDTLNLAAGCTYVLTTVENYKDGPNGLPSISTQIAINGSGATIERDQDGDPFRIFHIATNGDLALNQVTVRGGNVNHDAGGSGIYSRGRLALTKSTVAENWTRFGGCGALNNLGTATLTNSTVIDNDVLHSCGGICNSGALTLFDSAVESNGSGYAAGGILNTGSLDVIDSSISRNSSFIWAEGPIGWCGGINNEAKMTVQNSIITGNSAIYYGGGICNSGEATITDSTIAENVADDGAGIHNSGTLALNNSTISNNQGRASGGGIYVESGSLSVTGSTISGNTAYEGGGISNREGTVTLTNSTVDRNSGVPGGGGGIWNRHILTLVGSTVSHNTGQDAGGILNSDGTVILLHSTISGNDGGTGDGGGIASSGSLSIAGSTITGNRCAGPGAGIESMGIVTLLNTLVVGQATGRDCHGDAVQSLGYNMDSDGSCGLDAVGDLPNTTALLGPLQNNGGPTETHALQSDSPAIDQGSCPGVTADQRGEPRPIDLPGIPNADDGCDIGAYEVQAQDGGGYLVRVIVMNKGGERQAGYRISFFAGPNGSGELIATRTTAANGEADVRLPNGQYSYVAQKDCYQGEPVHFQVDGGRVVMNHKTMARVIIRVADNAGVGRSGYLVRTYDADGVPQWRQVSSGSGRTAFSLDLLENYLFSVERNRLQGPRYPVTDGPLCGPAEVRYTLATVAVHVQDAAGRDLGGYQVRVRRPDGTVHLYGFTQPDGVATLYLVEGEYLYQVGRWGVWRDGGTFTVAPPVGGPGGVADDRRIEYGLE